MFEKGNTVKLKQELAGKIENKFKVIGVVTDSGPNPRTWVSCLWDTFGAFVPISVFDAENLELVKHAYHTS